MSNWAFFHSAVLLVLACADIALLVGILHPAIKRKAGPTWIWQWGQYDPIRNIFFKADGSFRKYGRLFLSAILVAVLLGILYLMVAIWT